MSLNAKSSSKEIEAAIASLCVFIDSEHAIANALHRYLLMHRLLKDDRGQTTRERRELRRIYLAEVKLFEHQIRQIRLLKRIEMARSRNWDFASYLQGAWTILVCRTNFHLAYWGHALRVQGISRLVERSGYRSFNAIFFDLGEIAHLA